ncbi:hypothetical protein [Parachitinimonas caeni]|uniref:Uncharacterized protein n=1 Tax=Parachitinimonas caeni TaxID=3031301 RepID=A0ABT7E1Q2_9NEIS|nr:hypothetical protein [Parachitinimonas caeni]MDK2126242.1 hypothetical protein [Parachitinimonas caeni]
MNRADFRAFCATHNLSIEDAGRDWHDAGVKGAYLCAVLRDDEDFARIKPLLDNDDAYLASAERSLGQRWFEHHGYGHIYADDAAGVARAMSEQYARLLASKDDISHFSADDIAKRDMAFVDNPACEGESEDEHFERIVELQDDGWLVPRFVTEPGYWCCTRNSLMLSDAEVAAGLWSYSYDSWEQCVILILNDTKEQEIE